MIVVRCVSCGLRQYALRSTCGRCRAELGISFVEIPLSSDSKNLNPATEADVSNRAALRCIRLKRSKSRARFAAIAHTGRSYVSRIERDAATTNLSTFVRILLALGVESLYVRLDLRSS